MDFIESVNVNPVGGFLDKLICIIRLIKSSGTATQPNITT